MLHNVKLPHSTRRRLSEAMFWQFRLLRWAATTQTFDQPTCQRWLEQRPSLRPRASKIVDWVWDSKERCEPLQKFHADAEHAATKLAWVQQRQGEALRLLRRPQDTLEQIDYRSAQTPQWQKAAAAFLKRFYKDFRDNGLSECFFRKPTSGKFTAQDFLDAFLEENTTLCVCPVCDTTAYFTILQASEKREKDDQQARSIYAEIDHYLPKTTYPHLSIHPYNLVPLCHNCNSGAKGAKDPLASVNGGSYRLEEIWLPYRHPGLSSNLFISLKEQGHVFAFDVFAVKNEHVLEQQLDAVSDILNRIYQLPERWQKQIDQIGEKLFRRMRDYLRFLSTDGGGDMAHHYLNELLYILEQEDMTREPYAIPMLWWLAHLINAERSHKDTSLANEISKWHEHQIERSAEMRAHGERIRSYIVQRSEVKNDNVDGPEARQ